MSSADLLTVRILGRISAWRGDLPLPLGPNGRRAVLGLLALAGGRPLPRSELVDALWGDRPPPSAANVIQTHIAHLRRLLEPGRPSHARSVLLPAVGDGYALQVPPDDIDLIRFRRLVAAAAEGDQRADPPRAAALLDEALRLWQGPPFVDIPALASHPKIVALGEERRTALARYGEAMIAAGAAVDAIPVLEEAAAAEPLDEPGQARLIRAYHAAGRRARAIEVYREARRRLAEELGMYPGQELAAAHAELLAAPAGPPRPVTRPAGPARPPGAHTGPRSGPPPYAPAAAGGTSDLGGPPPGAPPGAARPAAPAQPGPASAGGRGRPPWPVHTVHIGPWPAGPAGPPAPAQPSAQPPGPVRPPAPAQPSAQPPGPVRPPGPAQPAPAQLPADVPDFVGRSGALAELSRLAGVRTADASAAAVPLVISGTAGVGKTALAVRWAHRIRGGFPDGQLYVNLRGYDPERPMPATAALAGFLRALGVPDQDLPADPAERAAAYRTRLDGRRVLIVLDNAGSVEQIRPLLPGSPSCQVLVTSRDRLAGLVAMHGARRLELDELPPEEATELLQALIGDRAGQEPAAVRELAGHCARLPLALRIAAELAASRPDTPLAGLVAELADQHRRLDLLAAAGDPRAAVRAVFSWSYQCLPAPAARLFRLLGLHPGPDYDPRAIAALAGTGTRPARDGLDLLARATLVRPAGPGRYGMHDLLRAYATELARDTDAEPDRQAALGRLFDHYLAAAAAAMDALMPGEQDRRPRLTPPPDPTSGSPARGEPAAGDSTPAAGSRRPGGPAAAADPPATAADPPAAAADPPAAGVDPPAAAAARAWLDTERSSLVAVIDHAAAHGWPDHAARLAGTLFRYFDLSGDLTTGLRIHSRAVQAASGGTDRVGAADALRDLGVVHARQGRLGEAARHFEQALVVYRAAGDRTGEARILTNLGNIGLLTGRYDEAAGYHRQAIDLHLAAGNQLGAAIALNSLGAVRCRQGRYADAADLHRQARALHQRAGHPDGVGYALNGLGELHAVAGRFDRAADHHRQALAIFQETGNRDGEACTLANLGEVSLGLGERDRAAEHLQAALALFEQTGNPGGQARARNGLGAALDAAGEFAAARAEYAAALALAGGSNDSYQLARAHRGLAATDATDAGHATAEHAVER